MKGYRVFSILLSLFMGFNTIGVCYGEEVEEQPITEVETEAGSDGEENYGGIISDDANNVPYYQDEVEAYSEIPSSYQLDKTKYPDVRDQGSYGTCWAFAALGLSEFDLINKGLADKTIDLSELQLAYYVYNSAVDPLGGTAGDQSTYYNDAADYSYLNRGGMYEYAVRRLSQWSGAVSESDVPYNTTNINSVLSNGLSGEYAYSKDVAHLENAYVMSLKNNTDDVKRAIMNNGAVGVQYLHYDNYLLWNSDKQLWTYYSPKAAGGGHNVMIVGWDDDFSKDNFVGDKPTNNGAWLIRNSWGFTQSYFWMSYESQSLLDAAWVFDMASANNYDNNYQLDGGIDSYNVSNTICQYKTYSNVFTVQKKDGVSSEKLDAVSLSFTHVANVNYKIEVYTDLKNENPYSGTKQESATTTGTTTYAGLYTISLNSPIQLKPGTSFAVVVTTDSYALDYEQGITWETDGTKIWDAPVSYNSGKSFYGNSNYQWSWYWGNFCIKAFTTNNTASCTEHTWDEGTTTTQPTCTEKGVKTFTCTKCGATNTEEVAALGHQYSTEWTTDVDPTCTTEGKKSHHCTREGCSAKENETKIDKVAHNYSNEYTTDKAATCKEAGSKSRHCLNCDAKTDVTSIPITDHNWDSGVVTKAATCTTAGTIKYTCKDCGKTKEETIKELGHAYSDEYTVDKKATCEQAGSKSRHCTRDGCTEKTDVTTIDALEHKYSTEYTIDKAATCKEEGSQSRHCTRDGCDSKTDVKTIDKIDHNWDSGVVTKEATCTTAGVKTFTCQTCKTTTTETINALGHDFSNKYTVDKEATCKEAGSQSRHCTHSGCNEKTDVTPIDALGHNYSTEWTIDKKATCSQTGIKSHHCTRCDSKTNETSIQKTDHNWNSGVVTKEATCTTAGVKTFTCQTCKTTTTETIAALGHDFSNEYTTDKVATCTEAGSKSRHCTRDSCDSKTDVKTIDKIDHNWDSGVVTKAATCTTVGTRKYTCTTCKETKTETINALGHDFSNKYTVDKEATCEQAGSKSLHCTHSGCNKKTDVTTIDALGHSWDSGVVTKAATCTTAGVKTFTCQICKTTTTKTIDALGHNFSSSWTIDKNATCTSEGSKSHHCSRCDSKTGATPISKLSHNWNSGVITKKATYNQNGNIQYTCKTCGTQKNDSIPKLSNRTESVTYRTHVQDYGWQSWKSNGESSGTSGQSKRLEGINIKINNKSVDGNIMYRTHVQNIGWQGWKSNGDMSGTSGQSLRLEAIQIKLTDELASSYDIYYRVHAQDYGWLDWAKNGESAGTEGKSKRLEAIQIKLVPKGNAAPGSTSTPFIYDMVSYRTHVQDYGWQSYVSDGVMSGTSGQSKRLEGINVKLSSSIDGGIQYRTHVQDYGWQNWVQNNQMAGTSGQSKRLEAIQIRLTGNIANQYDVYYRVHCQDFGWLGWAKNGESSGSEGYSKRLEGIQIVLVKKGSAAPGNTSNHFYRR